MPRGIRNLKNYEVHDTSRGTIFAIRRKDYEKTFKKGNKFFAEGHIWQVVAIEGSWEIPKPGKDKLGIGLVAEMVE